MGFTLLPLNQTVTDISKSKFRPQSAFYCRRKDICWFSFSEVEIIHFCFRHVFPFICFCVCVYVLFLGKKKKRHHFLILKSNLFSASIYPHWYKWEMGTVWHLPDLGLTE